MSTNLLIPTNLFLSFMLSINDRGFKGNGTSGALIQVVWVSVKNPSIFFLSSVEIPLKSKNRKLTCPCVLVTN